ncbi:MAG: hypothetical protein WKF83_09550 [Nocardioidaceae bacterium]
MLTAEVADPSGYGRIVRDGAGSLERIVEHKDASPAELDGQGGQRRHLRLRRWRGWARALQQVGAANAQGEIYLTDVMAIARADGLGLGAVALPDVWQCRGRQRPRPARAARRRAQPPDTRTGGCATA